MFEEALTLLRAHAVDTLNEGDLYLQATEGVVKSLHDPWAALLVGDSYDRFKARLDGMVPGVGLEVETRGGALSVARTVPGSPAQRAGLERRRSACSPWTTARPTGWSVERLRDALRGPAGSDGADGGRAGRRRLGLRGRTQARTGPRAGGPARADVGRRDRLPGGHRDQPWRGGRPVRRDRRAGRTRPERDSSSICAAIREAWSRRALGSAELFLDPGQIATADRGPRAGGLPGAPHAALARSAAGRIGGRRRPRVRPRSLPPPCRTTTARSSWAPPRSARAWFSAPTR